jgi:hypothetical protein
LFVLVIFSAVSLAMQILGISARDYVFLGAGNYWTPPPNFSLWGELRWDNPDQWPIWGHWLRFKLSHIPVIWRWQWADLTHFDPLALLAALLIIALGLGGLVIVYVYHRLGKTGVILAWLAASLGVALMLMRSHPDPRSIEQEHEAAKLWPAYQTLVSRLPTLATPADAVIFTDRRFEFYLLDTDKSPAQRYIIAKPTQPLILTTIPKLLSQQSGRIWLVTDPLDNRQLAYATELWLQTHASPVASYVFGHSIRLTAFEPQADLAPWSAIPAEPPLNRLVDPDDYRFKGIAALLGWNWPGLEPGDVTLQAGQTYPFELYWIYQGKAPEDAFFVRLFDSTGQIAVEVWLPPQNRSHLIPGQLVIEEAAVPLPADLPAGLYQLQLGFSTPAAPAGQLIFDLPAALTKLKVVN